MYTYGWMLVGALAGVASISGGVGLAALLAENVGLSLLTTLGIGVSIGIGSGIGCIRGKEAIEKNLANGRKVSSPSLINEGTVQGLLNGTMLGLAAVTAALAAGPAALLGAPLVTALSAAGTLFLGYFQGTQHQEKMAVEYESAKAKAAGMQQGMFDQLLTQFKGKDTPPTIDAPDIEAPEKVTKADIEEIERRSKKYSQQDTRNWAEQVQEYNEDKAVEAAR